MTPRERLVCVGLDEPGEAALSRLGDHYDLAPVLDADRCLGLVERRALRPGAPVRAAGIDGVALAGPTSLAPRDPFDRVIGALCAVPAAVVSDERGAFAGMIHFADLNRHVLRVYLYLWLSALEMALARLVARLASGDAWIDLLDHQARVMVLGRHQVNLRDRVELDPIEGVELADLVKVLRRLPRGVESLGLSSKTQFDQRVGHVVELRHAAMHPVRTLVRSHEDVPRLHAQVSDMQWLVRAAHAGA